MLSIINVPKKGYEKLSSKTTWIIDSGAACHMTYDLKLLAEIKNIRPVAIHLPNGAHTLAKKQGKIVLSEKVC